jgi:glycosyltransferase involved in cell wall biosynthesis
MRIAFYAPMKSPTSPVPSGDREMARNLIRALDASHEVILASEFVSRDGTGDPVRQRALEEEGGAIASALIENWQSPGASPPDAWFTYHVYHKAADWIGPSVSAALDIPYFMAEVSHAPKQAGGPWDIGYRATKAAIRQADGIIGLSGLDAACVLPILPDSARYHRLRPFTDTAPLADAEEKRSRHRAALAARFNLYPDTPILLAVGMMREGDKLASYRVLADALKTIKGQNWSLVIVGDGPARDAVECAFECIDANRLFSAGPVSPEDLPALYAGADLMVWPAINEAYGMAMLEAQAAGLPVVAGRTGGVPDVVRDGQTGDLCAIGDAGAFADAVAILLADPARRDTYRANALRLTASENDLSVASGRLNSILETGRKTFAA